MRRTVRRAARRMAGFLAIGAGIALVGWAAVLIAGASPYFRVDRIEVSGLSYLTRDEVRAAAGVDGRTSVWAREASLLDGLVAHPMIESARVTRDLPRTLLFEIDEAEPVGLVALPLVMAVDRHGNHMEIDPGEPVLDLPVLRVATERAAAMWGPRLLAREVAHMAEVAPELFAVISEARLDDDRITLLLGDSALRVHYHPPITHARLRDAVVAMNDAAERFPETRLHEVDLRFADQVVVRTALAAPGTGSAP